ncbi:site-specific DNA-methyltransferase [Salinimicrobium sp. TIG7-5_MAKvit]|uniref:DNA-methyltransferase n=1 Tax=Salinimicrobium sp. TIG7-5_MAKvit TaxID=3121289 RepID=UPI003C6DF881
MTNHKVYYSTANEMADVPDNSVNLVVTSPPYPMIEMWDEIMKQQNEEIEKQWEKENYNEAFELMHKVLDKVWQECYRVLDDGGVACINIGDATRTLSKNFVLYSNHSRIISACLKIGFQNLPNIIWRKQTNAPNKFMGSGMLPPGAYVTLEHEYILVLRKGTKREFKSQESKDLRSESAFFWEERNQWFSDIWEVKGTRQKFKDEVRKRSGAFPFDIPYRLINMFSVKGDTVLDPFMGTGTTALAAMASNRNSIGFEIDSKFEPTIVENLLGTESMLNQVISDRINRHIKFTDLRKAEKGSDCFKYQNSHYGFPVMTRQELGIAFEYVKKVSYENKSFVTNYHGINVLENPLALF